MIEVALTIQALILIAAVAAYVRSGQASAFHPATVYLAFHAIVFVAVPWGQHLLGLHFVWDYMRYAPEADAYVLTLCVSSLGLLAFFPACLAAGWARIGFRTRGLEFERRHHLAFVVVAAMLLPLGTYSAMIASRGNALQDGKGIQMARAANGVAMHSESTGYITDAQYMCAPILTLFIILTGFRVWSYAPMGLFIAFRVYQGWSRWSIVIAVLSLCLLQLWDRRRRWPSARLVAVAIPLWCLFAALGNNRHLLREYFDGAMPIQRRADDRKDLWADRLFDSLDFANFNFLAYVVHCVPERTGTYTYYTQYLQLFTEPIPRILWSGKPAGPPVSFFDLNDYGNFVGLTVSLVGDGWMSGGWIGVATTMAGVGWVLGAAHRRFWAEVGGGDVRYAVLYLCCLPLTIQWYRDGGISIAKFLLFTATPLLLWSTLAGLLGRYGRSPAPPPDPGSFRSTHWEFDAVATPSIPTGLLAGDGVSAGLDRPRGGPIAEIRGGWRDYDDGYASSEYGSRT